MSCELKRKEVSKGMMGQTKSGAGASCQRCGAFVSETPKGTNRCQVGRPGSSPSVALSGVLKSAVWFLPYDSCEPCAPCLLVLCLTYRNTLIIYYIVSGSKRDSSNLQLKLLAAHREGAKHKCLRVDEVKQSHFPILGPQ